MPASDSRPNLLTTAAINKLLEASAHRLGSARNHSGLDEPIDCSRKIILYPCHQLNHGQRHGNTHCTS